MITTDVCRVLCMYWIHQSYSDGGLKVWKLLTVLEFTAFPLPAGATVHVLRFADEFTYLVRLEEDSSGGLTVESSART